MRGLLSNITASIRLYTASNLFFYVVLFILAAQGLWYAFSFMPSIYDESVHIGTVYFFASNPNPFSTIQGVEWDFIGEITRSSSYVFFYLLSIPLNLFSLITSSEQAQIIFLRIIMIALFLWAIIMYRKAFIKAGVSSLVANVAILAFSLIPIFSVMPGVVTYDTALFLLFSYMLYYSILIIQAKNIRAAHILILYILSLSALVVKGSSALALVVPIVLYISYVIYSRYGRGFFIGIWKSFLKINRKGRLALAVLAILSTALVVERPISNMVQYQSFNAPCSAIKSTERCQSNYTARKNNELASSKSSDFKPYSPFEYLTIYWTPGLTNTMMRPLPEPAPFPIMQQAMFAALLLGFAVIVFSLRSLIKRQEIQLFVLIIVVYLAALFSSNYSAYNNIGQAVAMSGRYLLYIVPIFGILLGESLRSIARTARIKNITTLTVVIFFFFMLQGGGLTTYLLTYDRYWSGGSAANVNREMRSLVSPLILEKTPFRIF